MNSREDQIISKILGEATLIIGLIDGLEREAFLTDEKTKRAVCMTLINIGELVKLLSSDFRESHREIHWKAIAGLRDITAHRYQALQMGDIWVTAKEDIPSLIEKLTQLQ